MANAQFIQGKVYTLYGAGIITTDTSIILSSFTTPDGTLITTSDLGPQNWGTIAPNTSNEEAFSFTGVTQNADGTATLTGVVRGLLFVSPYTTSAALKQNHQGGTELILSNNPGMYDDFLSESTDETVTGTYTFTNFPIKSGSTTPTASGELSTKAYTDLVGTGTANYDQNLVAAVAGATVAAGEVVYLKETDGEWYLADASVSSTSENVILGIAQGAGTDGVAISGGVLVAGLDKNATYTAGSVYFLSDTAGALATSAGTVEVQLGVGDANNNLVWMHNATDETLTADEKDALAGNNGTPATANKYVTQTGFQLGAETYAVTATGNDTYVVTLSPVPAAYVAGMRIKMKVDVANTGACTINVNSLGAKSIYKNVTKPLLAGDILADQIIELVYDGTNFQLLSRKNSVVGDFGGDGSDSILNVTSGTTTLSAANANYLVKNYTTINISVGATLALSNKAANGTILHLKAAGDVTIAGIIDMQGMGADTDTNGYATLSGDTVDYFGAVPATPSGGDTGGTGKGKKLTRLSEYTITQGSLHKKYIVLACGSGGGTGSGSGGAGGAGGGVVIIECGGDLNFTGTIKIDGDDGVTITGDNHGGGGGGGACGMALVLYNTQTAVSGTISATGGDGGDGANPSSFGDGGGGGQGGGSPSSDGGNGGNGKDSGGAGAGGTGSNPAGAGAGAGGVGASGGLSQGIGPGGTGGATDTTAYLVTENVNL